MKQKIYPDLHGIDAWDQNNYGRVVVHSMNSAQFFEITGIQPPPSPIDAKTYTKHGLPWFDLYDETKGTVAPSDLLSKVKTITERDKERGGHAEGNQSIDVSEKHIKKIRPDNERKKE
ncbi:MAG: hypothetical protein BROFUL_01727 [Candidatus Brocadia fulgida]|uniref:Uncharacterized protein n=1 Tax=Candidatus Brocadia fulgida TaxID=380242 RepID=A0A0M2UX55_9BACT|nr:MAG: hypothetical protein BROFUL_01727 [Candidatus Brocadia fulgida]